MVGGGGHGLTNLFSCFSRVLDVSAPAPVSVSVSHLNIIRTLLIQIKTGLEKKIFYTQGFQTIFFENSRG